MSCAHSSFVVVTVGGVGVTFMFPYTVLNVHYDVCMTCDMLTFQNGVQRPCFRLIDNNDLFM